MIKNTQGGQVIIIHTLLFFALSSAIIFGVTYPVVSSFQTTSSFIKSKKAFMVASSASNEAIYKLNSTMDLASSETVTLAQGSADISVQDTGNDKTVLIDSDVEGYERDYEINLSIGEGVSFSYGLQAGQGGFEMSGSAGINGNAYANGDIIGSGGPYITGTAVSANITDPVIVTSNNTGGITPTNQVDFGGNTTQQDAAQSFTVSTTTPVSSIRIYIKKSGSAWMNNVTMRITADDTGTEPHKTTLAQGTISASMVTTNYGYLTVPLTSTVALTPGTTYWIVFDTSTTWGQYYSLGATDSAFSGGVAKTGSWSSSNGGTWSATSPSTLDAYFDVYVGGSTGIINGVTVGSSGVGDAWAFEVNNSTVAGTIYCQAGTGNNKSCDTSRGNPVQQPWPISEANIQEWKDIATAGVATSSISLGGSTTLTLGDTKINGNLSVGSGATLKLTGTVYVTGNISVSGGAIVRVDPSMGSTGTVLVTDGRVSSNGGGQFMGSGASGSYILLITTSTCPSGSGCSGDNAIEVTGGTGAVVLNAQNGTIEFSGGASARQATANKIIMSGGTTVTYESGLVNPSFSTGPSGSWIIESWKEVE